MAIELLLRLLSGIFSKGAAIFFMGFFFGSILLVNLESYYLFVQTICQWFMNSIYMLIGVH
jgi:hypothetical protein